jgi:hypothetical protein
MLVTRPTPANHGNVSFPFSLTISLSPDWRLGHNPIIVAGVQPRAALACVTDVNIFDILRNFVPAGLHLRSRLIIATQSSIAGEGKGKRLFPG